AQVSVPLALVKSDPAVAEPDDVAKSTLTAPPAPPLRETLSTTAPLASPTDGLVRAKPRSAGGESGTGVSRFVGAEIGVLNGPMKSCAPEGAVISRSAFAPSGSLKSTPSEPVPVLLNVKPICFGFEVLSTSFDSRPCGLKLVKSLFEVIVP